MLPSGDISVLNLQTLQIEPWRDRNGLQIELDHIRVDPIAVATNDLLIVTGGRDELGFCPFIEILSLQTGTKLRQILFQPLWQGLFSKGDKFHATYLESNDELIIFHSTQGKVMRREEETTEAFSIGVFTERQYQIYSGGPATRGKDVYGPFYSQGQWWSINMRDGQESGVFEKGAIRP